MPGSDAQKDITTTQGPLVILGLLVFVLVAGTVGYVWIEGWTVWDAFYMTIITITTVGYGEVHPLSRAGQEFTSVLLIVGVGTALYAFGLSASVIAEGGIFAAIQAATVHRAYVG